MVAVGFGLVVVVFCAVAVGFGLVLVTMFCVVAVVVTVDCIILQLSLAFSVLQK